ncbi:MAG: hypothetical protein FJX56_09200 [Alphaproteobacteria bacterium]|nr:hypothetical protein [Alphaproteobacteria bacterium]
MLALAALGLAACGGLLPEAGPPPDFYTLTPKTTFSAGLPAVEWQLVVEERSAPGGLAGQSIALRTTPVEIKYFASAWWSERAPRLVQTLLVDSFENSRRIVSVGRDGFGLRSDFTLRTDLREFQAEYADPDRAPLVRVRLNAKLIRQPRREIVASETFEATIQASGTAMPEVVLAFDEALGKVTKRVVEWTLLSGERRRLPRQATVQRG